MPNLQKIERNLQIPGHFSPLVMSSWALAVAAAKSVKVMRGGHGGGYEESAS
jgi:hypothetical protein